MRWQEYVVMVALAVMAGEAIESAGGGASAGNPVEVGKVVWGRDFAVAAKAAKASGKPIFALFQEVPG